MHDQPRRPHPDDAAKWSIEARHNRRPADVSDDPTLGFASEENEDDATESEVADTPRAAESTTLGRFPSDAPDHSRQTAVFPDDEMAAGDGPVGSRFAHVAAMVRRPSAIAIVAGALIVIGLYAVINREAGPSPSARAAQTGTATITSRPAGLEVAIDGEPRGVTPLKLDLPLGNHNLVIRRDDEVRSIPLAIEAGTMVSQYVELGSAAPSPATGMLEVTSEPPGSSVRLDGVAAGTTPLSLPTVTAGEHLIVVRTGETAVTRRVTVIPGATASIAASFGQTSSRGGWVSFKAPFEMQVFEGGRLIGTTNMDRVMLPTGPHELELLNEPLAFRKKTFVEVATGKTVTQTVMVGNGSLSVNASPWADVTIDGRAVGTTPLANISLPIGSHEVVLTHPQHGERRRTVVVNATSPARLGVDFAQ